MRRLKIAVCLIFVASCAIFAGYTVKSKMLEDHTPPVITCKDKTVTLSVQTDQKKQKKALLKGVKAEDNRDGDLTSSVRIASIIHSGLSYGERFDQWNKIKNNEVDVVVGARSAIFAPLENIGMIILDDSRGRP